MTWLRVSVLAALLALGLSSVGCRARATRRSVTVQKTVGPAGIRTTTTTSTTVIRTAPPARPRIVRARRPGPNYIWCDGHYDHRGGRYVWVKGRWRRPPRAGAVWVAGNWTLRGGTYVFVAGRWN